MKLYIYDHCPFCARVAYIAQSLGLDIELVSVDYDDAQTLIDLIGKRWCLFYKKTTVLSWLRA